MKGFTFSRFCLIGGLILGTVVAWNSLLGQDAGSGREKSGAGFEEKLFTCCNDTAARQCAGCYEWFDDCESNVNRGACLFQDEGEGVIPACAFVDPACTFEDIFWFCSIS